MKKKTADVIHEHAFEPKRVSIFNPKYEDPKPVDRLTYVDMQGRTCLVC